MYLIWVSLCGFLILYLVCWGLVVNVILVWKLSLLDCGWVRSCMKNCWLMWILCYFCFICGCVLLSCMMKLWRGGLLVWLCGWMLGWLLSLICVFVRRLGCLCLSIKFVFIDCLGDLIVMDVCCFYFIIVVVVMLVIVYVYIDFGLGMLLW